jgi:hypothetical protein
MSEFYKVRKYEWNTNKQESQQLIFCFMQHDFFFCSPGKTEKRTCYDEGFIYLFIYLFIAVLGFELRAYALSHSTSPFL